MVVGIETNAEPNIVKWNGVKHVQTFYLDGDLLGIVDEQHAEEIARDMFAGENRIVHANACEMK